MKIVVVAEKKSIIEILSSYIANFTSFLIHYRNPLKAMDNIEEINPDVVLFSAEDFPRHWKPYLILYRQQSGVENGLFILLKGSNFPFEEAAKAEHLGVNGILDAGFEKQEEIQKLKEILLRNNKTLFPIQTDSYIPASNDSIDFLFNHPDSLKIITGKILDISRNGLSFKPDYPSFTQDLKAGQFIGNCSLTIGEKFQAVHCRLRLNKGVLYLDFVSGGEAIDDLLLKYREGKPQRDLNEIIEKR